MNKVYVAAAGSGKTTLLVDAALKLKGRVLVTTYTIENSKQIRSKFIEKIGYVPENVTIKTWFSFLLEHGVRPYQNHRTDVKVKGMIFMEGRSARYIKSDSDEHYFHKNDIYSDKISKFVVECNEKSNGLVMSRLEEIYSHILIDEIQDMSGYDFDVFHLLFKTGVNIICVGDPRQRTYSTNNSPKYKNLDIFQYFEKKCKKLCSIDDTTLSVSHRCNKEICAFSSKLHPNLKPTFSHTEPNGDDDGIILIGVNDLEKYLSDYNPMQLRWDRKEKRVSEKRMVMNFGESKGLTFDRVIIFPTKGMEKWIFDGSPLEEITCSKFYVAITRARKSVAIVVDTANPKSVDGVKCYSANLVDVANPKHADETKNHSEKLQMSLFDF